MNKNKDLINNSKKNLFLILIYISLIVGFFLDENLAGGAIYDFSVHDPVLKSFKENFKYSFFNYKIFDHDHSPFFFMFLNFINLPFEGTYYLRFIYLHICLLVPFFFYKCLIEKYKNCNKNLLLILSSIILITPYFRSYAIWLGDVNLSLLFLLCSILFFFKLEKEKIIKKKYLYIFLHILFLAISAYIRPIYSFFAIYFFYKIFVRFGTGKELIIFITMNFFLSLPAFYYVFGLNNIFFSERINPSINLLSNNLLIISNIIFFYSLPFLLMNKDIFINKKIILNYKNYSFVLISLCITLFLIFNFNYDPNQTGGGIFFKFSNLFFKNNIFFYIVSFFTISFLLKILFDKKINDILIILVLIVLDPDNYVLHKTYDPLLLCVFILLIESSLFTKLTVQNQKNFTFNLFIFYILILFMFIFIRTQSTIA